SARSPAASLPRSLNAPEGADPTRGPGRKQRTVPDAWRHEHVSTGRLAPAGGVACARFAGSSQSLEPLHAAASRPAFPAGAEAGEPGSTEGQPTAEAMPMAAPMREQAGPSIATALHPHHSERWHRTPSRTIQPRASAGFQSEMAPA